MSLTYVPTVNTRPFRVGETVLVLDREGKVISRQTVKRINKRTVETGCGRLWSLAGEYVGDNGVWPFPSITPESK
jgi:hypothetical protein